MEEKKYIYVVISQTGTLILRFLVTEKRYAEMKTYLEEMYENKKQHKYNYIGAFLANFGKNFVEKETFTVRSSYGTLC